MTLQRMTSFLVKRQAFASEWVTSSKSSVRTTTTGGRASLKTPRMAQLGLFLLQSCRSGENNNCICSDWGIGSVYTDQKLKPEQAKYATSSKLKCGQKE